MKPPLTPSGSPRHERIAVFGPEGCGKTTMWLTIAKWHQRMKSPATFFALDTDFTLEAMLSSERYSDLTNVIPLNCPDWESLRDNTRLVLGDRIKKTKPKAKEGDWLICDMITQGWSYAQNFYVEQSFGMDAESYFIAKKREAGDVDLKYGELFEWPVVNKIYQPWAVSIVSAPNIHFFATAGEKDPPKKESDADLRTLFARSAGKRPDAQKSLGHQMHTVLHVQMVRDGEPTVLSVKDRERELLKGATVKDFVREYLMPVGGWALR